jgi:predicted XRE-type DNA-binding protein
MCTEPSKRKDLTIHDKVQILENFDKLPKMGQRSASQALKISQPLLCKILKERDQIFSESKQIGNLSYKRKRCRKNENVEQALKLWVTQTREEGRLLDNLTMRKKAGEIALQMGKTDFVATDGWFGRWKKRESIDVQQELSESNAEGLSPIHTQPVRIVRASTSSADTSSNSLEKVKEWSSPKKVEEWNSPEKVEEWISPEKVKEWNSPLKIKESNSPLKLNVDLPVSPSQDRQSKRRRVEEEEDDYPNNYSPTHPINEDPVYPAEFQNGVDPPPPHFLMQDDPDFERLQQEKDLIRQEIQLKKSQILESKARTKYYQAATKALLENKSCPMHLNPQPSD